MGQWANFEQGLKFRLQYCNYTIYVNFLIFIIILWLYKQILFL